MAEANSFYYLKNKPFYHYVFNDSSVTHSVYKDKYPMLFRLYEYLKNYFSPLGCKEFDRQIELFLLHSVYLVTNEIYADKKLTLFEKQQAVTNILNKDEVKKMFSRIKINSLDISCKQKIITAMYKAKWIPGFFVRHMGE